MSDRSVRLMPVPLLQWCSSSQLCTRSAPDAGTTCEPQFTVRTAEFFHSSEVFTGISACLLICEWVRLHLGQVGATSSPSLRLRMMDVSCLAANSDIRSADSTCSRLFTALTSHPSEPCNSLSAIFACQLRRTSPPPPSSPVPPAVRPVGLPPESLVEAVLEADARAWMVHSLLGFSTLFRDSLLLVIAGEGLLGYLLRASTRYPHRVGLPSQ